MRTKTIILDALIGVIQAGLRNENVWNVKVILTLDEDTSTSGRQQNRQSHKTKRNVDIL